MRLILACTAIFTSAAVSAAPVEGRRGMVASASPVASAAGVEMLRAGGNAVDAAVATAFVLAVVEPSASGIGGGGFALTRMNESVTFLDFRETAPATARPDMYVVDGALMPDMSRDGVTAAGVPGAVAGYLALHGRYGKLPREKILAPAIRHARQGFRVDERYRDYAGRRLMALSRNPEAARLFLRVGPDKSWKVPDWGELILQPDLARTLEAVARKGRDGFYRGPVAEKLVRSMQQGGGYVSARDLADYQPRWRTPLMGSFRGMAIATAPPPSAGGHIVLSLLAAIERFSPQTSRADPDRLTAYLETSRRVYADRMLFGDPAYVGDPTALLTSTERLRYLAETWSGPRVTIVQPGEGSTLAGAISTAPSREGENTTHLSVVDADGNAVSMTTTVNYWFGAAVVAAGTGVLWNDEMDDFAIGAGVRNAWELPGSRANAVGPGRRPLSSMSPTLVFAGPNISHPIRLVVGAPGGPRIPMQVATVVEAHLRTGENIHDALATPRILHPWSPDTVFVERGALDPATQTQLKQAGYKLEEETEHRRWGNGSAIAIDPVTGLRTGSTDPRGVGAAVAE